MNKNSFQPRYKGYFLITMLFFSVLMISSCAPKEASAPGPEVIPPAISNISVVADPSYEERFTKNPYSQISKHTLEAYHADQDLYNFLYKAISNMETSVDIADFDLTKEEIMKTCESLYEQAGFQLYYLSRVRWSSDYKTVSFKYIDHKESIEKNQVIFYAQMNHLLNNVAPANYTSLQKFFLIYDDLSKNTRYTDDISDVTTHSAYSLLVKGKGICGGYAQLANYILNDIGIPSEYISNEPHAWNIIQLNGKRYHTDFTWGAGYTSDSYLNTVLMDDKARNDSLDRAGFGGFQIIEGSPRIDPTTPAPITDNRYQILNDVYSNYAIDIDQSWIYFSDYQGIHRIDLEGTNVITIQAIPGDYLTFFGGVLYYRGYNTNELYQVVPGEEPELLDDAIEIDGIKILNGILTYGNGQEEKLEKSINLNQFTISSFENEDRQHKEAVSIPSHQSFRVDIAFNQDMDTTLLPKELIGLITESDKNIPLHMFWSEDKRILTLRSKENLSKEDRITFYINSGLTTADGQLTTEGFEVPVILE